MKRLCTSWRAAFREIKNGHWLALELATVEAVSSLGLKRWGEKAGRRDEGVSCSIAFARGTLPTTKLWSEQRGQMTWAPCAPFSHSLPPPPNRPRPAGR